MCDWQGRSFDYARGKIYISADVFQDACQVIHQAATYRQTVTYYNIMDQLKRIGHKKINRGTIGKIVGEVSLQVSQVTKPSIYPSCIVVRADTNRPGNGFWGVDTGTRPPRTVASEQRKRVLGQYQEDVFDKSWNCECQYACSRDRHTK